MKTIEIAPRKQAPLYATLVKREAEIRQGGRGTFVRAGRKTAGGATWRHKKYKGSVSLRRGAAEVVTAKVRSPAPEDERRLLNSFLGFVDRQCGERVSSITIHYD
jgi:hypothetical protein